MSGAGSSESRNLPRARRVSEPVPTDRTDPAMAAPDFSTRLAAAEPALRRHARALVGGRGPIDPEDVVQETLSRAWSRRASFDGTRELMPWLKTIALRGLLDLREAQGRSPAPLEFDPIAKSAEDPVATRDEVRALLARLPERERVVLERFHRGGESIQDLALDLGLAPGTIKSLLHRARARLARGERL
jgi:RNA polymerase sigma-70 factor, ECF subfamily